MTYPLAIFICKNIENPAYKFSNDERLQAISKILSMETINATPKEALINALRWIFPLVAGKDK